MKQVNGTNENFFFCSVTIAAVVENKSMDAIYMDQQQQQQPNRD